MAGAIAMCKQNSLFDLVLQFLSIFATPFLFLGS